MDLVILGVLGVVVIALGFVVQQLARLNARPAAAGTSCFASCHAQACQAEPCGATPCLAQPPEPCRAERVDLSGLDGRLGELSVALDAGMEQVHRLAIEERARDRAQHAEVLQALRSDVQQLVGREADTVLGLAQVCSDLGHAADRSIETATQVVRAERQRALREKIRAARARRGQA